MEKRIVELEERVLHFREFRRQNELALPMHTGTNDLVDDLWAEVLRLSEVKECNCHAWSELGSYICPVHGHYNQYRKDVK